MSFNIADFEVISRHILAVSSELVTSGWYITPLPEGLNQPEWVSLVTRQTLRARLRIAGRMALQIVDDGRRVLGGCVAVQLCRKR
jgi:hypothetical protein